MDSDVDFRLLVDQLHDSILIVDQQLHIIFFNKKADDLGLRSTFKVGKSFMECVPIQRRSDVQHLLDLTFTTREPQVFVSDHLNADGKSVHLELTFSLIPDRNGRPNIFMVFRENTHEKYLERKSNLVAKDYSNLIASANAIIFGVDSRGYVTDWNNECTNVTGFDQEDVFAHSIEQFLDDDSISKFKNFFSQLLSGNPSTNIELTLKHNKNSSVVVLLNATPKLNDNGTVVGGLFVGQDISELSRYRASLEQQVENRTRDLKSALEKEKELVDLKNKFISMASHEFKVPLSTILRATDDIRSAPAKVKQSLSIIQKQVSHLQDVIDDVLTLDKTGVTKIQANNKPVDLNAFLADLAIEVSSSFNNSHEIRFDAREGSIQIMSDEKLLRNIFVNLFSNAIKFSPNKSFIDVVIASDEDIVDVKVIDYGIGIEENDKQKLFTAFNRGSNTGSIKGTGLGLSIVRRALDALHGEIIVQSTLGQGTSFTVKLKLNHK